MNYTPASKFRHVYCPGLQRICTAVSWIVAEEIYQGFRVASTTGDQTYIKGNAKYFAFPAAGGGGPILIRPHNTPGRMPSQLPLLTGHKWRSFVVMIGRGDLCDFDFNPFNDEQIISSSADLSIMVFSLSVCQSVVMGISWRRTHMQYWSTSCYFNRSSKKGSLCRVQSCSWTHCCFGISVCFFVWLSLIEMILVKYGTVNRRRKLVLLTASNFHKIFTGTIMAVCSVYQQRTRWIESLILVRTSLCRNGHLTKERSVQKWYGLEIHSTLLQRALIVVLNVNGRCGICAIWRSPSVQILWIWYVLSIRFTLVFRCSASFLWSWYIDSVPCWKGRW